jgi:hypothetical protein
MEPPMTITGSPADAERRTGRVVYEQLVPALEFAAATDGADPRRQRSEERVRRALQQTVAARIADGRLFVVQVGPLTTRPDRWYPDLLVLGQQAIILLLQADQAEVGDVVHSSAFSTQAAIYRTAEGQQFERRAGHWVRIA